MVTSMRSNASSMNGSSASTGIGSPSKMDRTPPDTFGPGAPGEIVVFAPNADGPAPPSFRRRPGARKARICENALALSREQQRGLHDALEAGLAKSRALVDDVAIAEPFDVEDIAVELA